jgi:hypothetical protein
MAGAFHSAGNRTLVLGTVAGLAARADFSFPRYERA